MTFTKSFAKAVASHTPVKHVSLRERDTCFCIGAIMRWCCTCYLLAMSLALTIQAYPEQFLREGCISYYRTMSGGRTVRASASIVEFLHSRSNMGRIASANVFIKAHAGLRVAFHTRAIVRIVSTNHNDIWRCHNLMPNGKVCGKFRALFFCIPRD